MTIATKKIEKLKRGLSDDPEVKAALQHYNEQMEDAPAKVDGRTKQYKETLRRIQLRKERMKKEAVEEATNEETIRTEGSKEEYQKFFNAALKKFGAKSPAEMDDEKKKKFFNYIDKNWTKEEQQEFSEGELPPALKKAIAAKKAKKGDEDEDKDPVGEKKEEVELEEKIEYVEYKFKNKAQAKAAAKFFDGQQLIDLDVNDDGASEGLLSVDAGKNDMTKVHNAIMKKMKPKVITTESERKKIET